MQCLLHWCAASAPLEHAYWVFTAFQYLFSNIKLLALKVPRCSLMQVANGSFTEIASIYDTVTNTFEPFHIPEAPFCGAQTILPDGRAILVGGDTSI